MNEPYTIDAWPLCPGCQRPRHTMCAICGTAGCDFRPADHDVVETIEVHELEMDETAGEPATVERLLQMLMCSTFDEPFEPRFARRCEWCGHDFGDGYEFSMQHSEPISPRTLAVGAALVAVLLGVMIYFAMIVG